MSLIIFKFRNRNPDLEKKSEDEIMSEMNKDITFRENKWVFDLEYIGNGMTLLDAMGPDVPNELKKKVLETAAEVRRKIFLYN